MPSLTDLSLSSSTSLTTAESLSTHSAISSALTLLGWQDPSAEITAANTAERKLADTLQANYARYQTSPDQTSKDNLTSSLSAVISKLEQDKTTAIRLAKQANDRLTEKTIASSKGVGFFSGVTTTLNTFFGSNDRAMIERYKQLAQKYETQLQELSTLRDSLHDPAAELGRTEEYSLPQRRLLQTVNAILPVTIQQFCYSTLGCDLGTLSDGSSGFQLQGEAAGDLSGFSVSTAGDVNGDGIADLIVGAHLASSHVGKSYVVFGSRNSTAWGSGRLNLGSLIDGRRGFVLQGESTSNYNGFSVSTAGDINGDDIDDLIVGAHGFSSRTGKNYVVFGSNLSTAWGNGRLNLGSLMNGQRGFSLQGEAAGDISGWSVSSAGDINGDGVADLIVGGQGESPRTGKSYVVFGSRNNTAWSSGALNLGSLKDGQRGFLLQEEAAGDNSGQSVSSAGDINGDGVSDIIVGAPAALSSTGKSYVVFGSRNSTAWGNGVLNLASLINGQQGFVLRGETENDVSGISVSTAGDVNGDGVSDIIVGARDPLSGAGKSYVVFGSRNSTAWGNGVLNLVNLMDGQRGFVVQGEAANDKSGNSVSTAGDVNGDGVSDIIVGAYGALSQTGKSYVVFGKVSPFSSLYFTANYLYMGRGETILLTPQNLAVSTNQTMFNENTTRFVIQNVVHGNFTKSNAPTSPITVFSMQEVNDRQIQFTHDDSIYSPQYRVSATNLQAQNSRLISIYSDAQVDFIGYRPNLVKNSLTVNQYVTTLVQASDLNAADRDNNARELFFTISNLTYGEFTLYNVTTRLTAPTIRFSQQDVLDSNVRFVQDGTHNAPSYAVTVNDLRSTTSTQAASITFRLVPQLITNPTGIIIDQGQPTTLTQQDINATGVEAFTGALIFEVSNVIHGHFAYANSPNSSVSVFQKLSLITNAMQFVQDGSPVLPNFTLRAFDGLYNAWQFPFLRLNHRPILQGTIGPQSVIQDEEYDFILPQNLFIDPDVNDTLIYRAQLAGGAPLPVGIEFDHTQQRFSGKLPTVSSFKIEVQASDRRSVTTSTRFVLSAIESKAAYYRSLYGSLSGVVGTGVAVLAYLWLRKRIAKHRRDFPLANDLRKVLNLEYYDFTRFDGDTFKTRVNDFFQRLNLDHPGFYDQLTPAEQKSFALCVAEILTVRGLVSRSEYAGALFGILCCLNVGWPSELNLKAFESQSVDIAEEAVATWEKESGYTLRPMSDLSKGKEKGTIYVEFENDTLHYTVIDVGVRRGGEQGSITAEELELATLPTTLEELERHLPKILEITLEKGHTKSDKALKKWPYHPPSRKEKAQVFLCCAKPSTAGMFAASRRAPGIELENLKKREGKDSSLVTGFAGEQKGSSDFESRMLSVEKGVKKIEIMAVTVKTIAEKVEALEENRPLLQQGR